MNRSHAIIVVSKKLKLIRLEHELTQHQLANALGISKRTVDQIETGGCGRIGPLLSRYARYFKTAKS
ncbi:hypothetical protein JCM19046_2807 [Bacillus sp. JCM 19046]|nr:hypothetical protein JCM19046_2807 [Bacillus sp. JCM 19046]